MANTSPPSSGAPLPSTFRWRIQGISIKIEDTVFTVDRHALIEASPVLKTMLDVGRSVLGEGASEDNPVVLEGYKARDFEALLRIVYPTTHDLISGQFALSKYEWVWVSRLARGLEMKEIRQFAIKTLSGSPFALSAVEKVQLGRDLGVSSWLIEGLVCLVQRNPNLGPDELEEAVGLRSAFRIVALQARLLPTSPSNSATPIYFPMSSVHCCTCAEQLLLANRFRCGSPSCAWKTRMSGETAAFILYDRSGDPCNDVGGFLRVKTTSIMCNVCRSPCWFGKATCRQCCREVNGHVFLKAKPPPATVPPSVSHQEIENTFKDELAQCDM